MQTFLMEIFLRSHTFSQTNLVVENMDKENTEVSITSQSEIFSAQEIRRAQSKRCSVITRQGSPVDNRPSPGDK